MKTKTIPPERTPGATGTTAEDSSPVPKSLADVVSQLKSLLQAIPDVVYIKDTAGRNMVVNRAFEELAGRPAAEILGRTDEELLPADLAVRCRESDLKVLGGRGSIRFEEVSTGPDGAPRYFETVKSPIHGEASDILGLVGVSRDITDRKIWEERLAESERRFRAIFETAQEVIFLKDKDLRYALANPAAAKLFGRSADAFAGCTDEDLFGREEAERCTAGDRRVLAGEVVEEESVRTVGDRVIVFHTIKVPIRNESGEIVGVCGIARDTTERRRMEEALRASVREKEVLIKEVHHRVKNNMQIISSILSLQAGSVRDPAARECLAECQNRIRSMALVHEKLYRSGNLSRIDFGEYLRSLTAALFHACRTDADRVRLDFSAADVSLDVNTAIPCGLIANELIINALKHGFPAGRTGSLRIGLDNLVDGRYRMVVADDGAGFPKDLDFRMTETLGLQLVTLLVGQLDGTIELDRERGTAFTITFNDQKPA